jgi:two-component system sensor histidine kinase EvgS
MSQEEQCSVFRPFDFSENQIHAAKVSTGLGLHIAKRLCEKMNGSIRLISTPGKGTIVKVKVTLDIIPIELPYFQEHQQIPKLSNIAKVLVVDDNTTNIFVLKAMLTKIAVECDDAHNGQEAVSKYEKLPYALVLMDINMPIMNGYEASKAIRAKAAKECWPVTIVAVSAQDEPRKESDLSNFGIDKWVEKPMKIDCLKEMLKYSGIFESSSNNKCA